MGLLCALLVFFLAEAWFTAKLVILSWAERPSPDRVVRPRALTKPLHTSFVDALGAALEGRVQDLEEEVAELRTEVRRLRRVVSELKRFIDESDP